jgi:hypothetical protein
MQILHLTLKKEWFDMISSGEKKEEYREVKDYWMKRLAGIKGVGTGYNFTLLGNRENKCLEYDAVHFRNGYSKNAPEMLFDCKGIKADKGKKKWGAPDYEVFVIKLGKRIE